MQRLERRWVPLKDMRRSDSGSRAASHALLGIPFLDPTPAADAAQSIKRFKDLLCRRTARLDGHKMTRNGEMGRTIIYYA